MRLIDADALSALLEKESHSTSCEFNSAIRYANEFYVETMPTITAVDVVRCQVCKYFDFVKPNIDKPWGVCEYHNRRFAHEADDYCKNGERK